MGYEGFNCTTRQLDQQIGRREIFGTTLKKMKTLPWEDIYAIFSDDHGTTVRSGASEIGSSFAAAGKCMRQLERPTRSEPV